jgi:hypothetical protein
MTSGDEYRARAAECTQAAKNSTEPQRRVGLLELAQKWLRMAEQADALGATKRLNGDVLLDRSGSG